MPASMTTERLKDILESLQEHRPEFLQVYLKMAEETGDTMPVQAEMSREERKKLIMEAHRYKNSSGKLAGQIESLQPIPATAPDFGL